MAEINENNPLVKELITVEHEVSELVNNPKFFEAFKLKKELDDKLAEGWKKIEGLMVLTKTKKISGDFGYITLVERMLFDVDTEQLPPKFFKKVPDTKKIGDTYKLTNKLPAGVTPIINTSLRKDIK